MSESCYSFALTQAPKEEALTLGEVKSWLRIDEDLTDDDVLLESLIGAVARYTEATKNLALTTQKWNLYFEQFPCEIEIPQWPVISVDAIKYIDSSGAQQALSPLTYQVDLTKFVPEIRPVYGSFWPNARCQYKAVQVELTLGYGAAAQVPAHVKAGMLMAIGHLYENREDTVAKNFELVHVPMGFHHCLASEAIVNC